MAKLDEYNTKAMLLGGYYNINAHAIAYVGEDKRVYWRDADTMQHLNARQVEGRIITHNAEKGMK
ncbi:hypothetical protein EVB41_039 [Rhizobium phage RHph_TM3_14A]|nr:hypothetical protein EVB31_038 [Rhizobium phage RHph_TM29]QIG67504.1 hypothetical protein EVB41_039 [Rhizobium phage RHph_TM3_14A]